MMTLHIMAEQLKNELTVVQMLDDEYLPIENVVLLTGDEDSLDSNILYVAEPEILLPILERLENGTRFMAIAVGEITIPENLRKREELVIFSSSISMRQLGNRLIDELFAFSRWTDELRAIVYRGGTQKELLRKMANRIQCPVFLMNSGYHLLAADVNYSFEDRYIQKLLMNGYLDSYSVDAMLQESRRIPLHIKERVNSYQIELDTGHCAMLCEIWERRRFLGQFLVLTEQEKANRVLADYVRVMASIFWQYAAMERNGEIVADNSYADLLCDLIEGRIHSEAELSNREQRLTPPMTPKYQVMAVAFENENESHSNNLLKSLNDLIPDSEVIRYEAEIIIFRRIRQKEELFTIPKEALQQVLEQERGYFCVGGCSKFLSSFASVYRQVTDSLRLGIRLTRTPEERILNVNDYHLLRMIDLSASRMDEMGERDLIYLCSQQYTALYRYDMEHESNLCGILESYIQNNCNTSQTAKELFLHRNTLINKIARIEEIVGGSLNNVSLRHQLYFSSQLIYYIKEYRREDPYQRNSKK